VDYDAKLTVILNNSTRWNSAFLSIQRGLRMKSSLEIYLLTHGDALQEDKLIEEDWQQLKEIAEALEPFWQVTMRLQGQGDVGTHGVIWEVLPALDYLLEYCETKMNELAAQVIEETPNTRNNRRHIPHVNPLQIAYQNAWEKLRKYNDLTDEAYEIYAAGALLNPCLRKAYFTERWTGDAAAYIVPMLVKNKNT